MKKKLLATTVLSLSCSSWRSHRQAVVAALIAMNRPDQLRFHLVRAQDNGVTQDELIEAITHMAFYTG